MSRASRDVAIVGGGIVGAAAADALAREGIGVVLVESGIPGGGATAASMGHIVVMDDSPAQFELTHYCRALWDALVEELPEDCEVDRCGTIWIAADEAEMAAVERKRDYYAEHGVAVEVLDSGALAEAEPSLRGSLAGGLRVAGDMVVYAPCVVRRLIERAKARGAQVRTGSNVVELTDDGVRLSDGSTVSAGLTVIATGIGAADLVPGLRVRPRKGHLLITDRYPGAVRHQLIELGYLQSAHSDVADSVALNVQPRRTGQLLIGSSRQYDDRTGAVRTSIVSRMARRAVEYLPGLGQASVIRAWTGFRAATDDGLPLIGPAPGRDRVYLATGHEGLGITMSLGTAELLVDHVLRRESKIASEPYLPTREGRGGTHGR